MFLYISSYCLHIVSIYIQLFSNASLMLDYSSYLVDGGERRPLMCEQPHKGLGESCCMCSGAVGLLAPGQISLFPLAVDRHTHLEPQWLCEAWQRDLWGSLQLWARKSYWKHSRRKRLNDIVSGVSFVFCDLNRFLYNYQIGNVSFSVAYYEFYEVSTKKKNNRRTHRWWRWFNLTWIEIGYIHPQTSGFT